MRDIYIKSKAGLLNIGRRGENLATRVHLPEVPESGQYVTVYIMRNGDSASYPASNVEITDTEIIWTVTSVDTGKSGRGKVQYRFSDSVTGEIIKTEIYGFMVGLAIDTEVDPAPDPYETWLDSLTELAGQAQVAAREAEDYAESASESAEQAETSAQNAEQSASQANTYATNAHTSATSATASEASARQSAISAEASAESAQASAESAEASATSAEGSAESASASAESASESKTDAEAASQSAHEWGLFSQTYASQAAASATSAGQSATEASQSAQTATAKAAEAALSATQAINSAISAADSEQGAVAKASEASASATAAQEARTGAETAQAGAESAAQTAQAGADAVGLLREQIYNSYPNVEAETGSIVSISDGADGIPVKSLVVGIEPVQSGSGDPSPTNVRPITGWTGAKVTRTGKNWLDQTNEKPSYYETDSDGAVTNTNSTFGWNYANSCFKSTLPAGDYTLIVIAKTANGGSSNTQVWPSVGSSRIAAVNNSSLAAGGKTFTNFTLSETTDIGVCLKNNGGYNWVMIVNRADSSLSTFEPYQGETYDITFPSEAGTVYGGSLDVASGVLTVDRAGYAFNGTENYWIKSSTYGGSFYLMWNVMPAGAGIVQRAFTCSHAGYVPNFREYAYGKCGSDSALNLWLMQDPDATINDLKAFLAEQYANGTPVTVCYTLATPITYQLTPTEVKTLLGSNAIWADTGDVSLAYRADTKLYIDGVYEDYQDDLADYADALAALG